MGLTAFEEVAQRLNPAWLALEPIKALHVALTKFISEELPEAKFDAEGMSKANPLAGEFMWEIFPHRIPTIGELVHAELAGKLQDEIDAINGAYTSAL